MSTNEMDEIVEALPTAPLPPILVSNVPGTWAYDTMSRRLRDDILNRIYDENDLDATPELQQAKKGLDALIADLSTPRTSILRPIFEDGGPEVAEWNRIMAPYLGQNWLDAPWLYTEFYAYRRLMEAVEYFKTGFDPFANQKMLGVTSAMDSIETLAKRLLSAPPTTFEAGAALYVSTALWGNRMDLSLWPVAKAGAAPAAAGSNSGGDSESGVVGRAGEDVFAQILAAGSANLLADDLPAVTAVLELLKGGGGGGDGSGGGGGSFGARVDIVVDNAGFELFCDLCLADFLVSSGAAGVVVLQLKGHPTFVSDAMAKDLIAMVDDFTGLEKGGPYEGARAVGERWRGLISAGKWVLREDFYWAQPRPYWELPRRIREEFASSSALVILKGDANYRRLLGDRAWDPTTPFADITAGFPTRLLALRTLKAEVGCGMAAEQVARAKAADLRWMVSGKWGCVQLFDPFAAAAAAKKAAEDAERERKAAETAEKADAVAG